MLQKRKEIIQAFSEFSLTQSKVSEWNVPFKNGRESKDNDDRLGRT